MNRITQTAPSFWKRDWFPGVLLIAATFLAYFPALHGGFIWDDDAHLTKNPCVVGPIGFKGIWTSSAAVYYPLVLTSFWVQHALWGLNPMPYHLVNIAMHAMSTVLLWQVLLRLNVRGAWLGAALWALYPVQVESVAWITELKNTQSCLFYLLTILFFLSWRASQAPTGERNEWFYRLALLCATLAILSKASTVMLPVVLGLCWWWKDCQWRWRNIFRLVPFLLISTAASGWTIWEQQFHSGALGPEWAQTWPERLVVAGKIIWFYLGKLAWPYPLIFVYPRWTIEAARPLMYLPTLAVIIALFVLWLNRNGWLRPAFFAFAYFVVSLFPVLDFFKIYFFRYSFVGDHFQYLAGIGPLALVAAGITTTFSLGFFRKGRPFLEPGFYGALLLVLGVLTWHQCGMYADNETLWRTTIARNPDATIAYNNLSDVYSQKGQLDMAIAYSKKALEISPNSFEALNNLGNALLKAGQTEEAIASFEKAINVAPTVATSHYNLGNTLLEKGQTTEAMEQFQRALEIRPDYPEAQNNLGVVLMRLGRLDEAMVHYEKALVLNPAYAESCYNQGCIFDRQGKLEAAIKQYERAIQYKPDYTDAHDNLAEAHYRLGQMFLNQDRPDEAVAHYRNAIALKPDYADAHGNLANVLAVQGKLDEAIQEYQQTLALIPNSAQAHFRYGQALQTQHRFQPAIAEYQKTLELDFHHLPVRISLAWLLATCPDASLRDGNRAVELAKQAGALAGIESPQLLDTQAAAYAEAGQFDKAIETAQRALNLNATQNNQPLAEAIQSRLKLYGANAPYHEQP